MHAQGDRTARNLVLSGSSRHRRSTRPSAWPRVIGPSPRSAMRWLVALLLSLPLGAPLGQGAPWVVKAVHGYRIALAVESVLAPAQSGEDPRHARVLQHRLLVSVREQATGRTVPLATVTADVAESGYSGTTIALRPLASSEEGLYEGRTRLRTETPHRILIHVIPVGVDRTLEAQFDYLHHH